MTFNLRQQSENVQPTSINGRPITTDAPPDDGVLAYDATLGRFVFSTVGPVGPVGPMGPAGPIGPTGVIPPNVVATTLQVGGGTTFTRMQTNSELITGANVPALNGLLTTFTFPVAFPVAPVIVATIRFVTPLPTGPFQFLTLSVRTVTTTTFEVVLGNSQLTAVVGDIRINWFATSS